VRAGVWLGSPLMAELLRRGLEAHQP
jgi:hypothetical protein